MIIGFTGTSAGMTQIQKNSVKMFLEVCNPSEVAHGDCIGADKDFDDICKGLKIIRFSYPSNIPKMRACTGATQVQEPKPPLMRNHDIVNRSDILLACPKEINEVLRSGTWATIRHARMVGKPVYIIYPSGCAVS